MLPFSSLWRFTSNLAIADPGAGRWRWNSNAAPTQMAIDNNDEDGNDRSVDLALLVPTDRISVRSTSVSGNWGQFEILSATNLTTWFRFDVTLIDTGITPGLPNNNERTLFDFVRPAVGVPPTVGDIGNKRDEILARVGSLLRLPTDDVWLAAAVDSAIEYTTMKTERGEIGLPDTPLTVSGIIIFSQRLYLDTPNGVQVAAGDPQFEPIYQPEHLWRHMRHYFDHLDVAYGVA